MAGRLAVLFVLFLAFISFFVLISTKQYKEVLKLNIFLLSSFVVRLKGSVLVVLNIIFSYFIIALFFRLRGLESFDLYFDRSHSKFVPFALSDLKFGVVLGGGGG